MRYYVHRIDGPGLGQLEETATALLESVAGRLRDIQARLRELEGAGYDERMIAERRAEANSLVSQLQTLGGQQITPEWAERARSLETRSLDLERTVNNYAAVGASGRTATLVFVTATSAVVAGAIGYLVWKASRS